LLQDKTVKLVGGYNSFFPNANVYDTHKNNPKKWRNHLLLCCKIIEEVHDKSTPEAGGNTRLSPRFSPYTSSVLSPLFSSLRSSG